MGGLKAEAVMANACLVAGSEGGKPLGPWCSPAKMGNWSGSSVGAVTINFSEGLC